MVVNLIDAGYFVSRAAKHWAHIPKGRNLRWYQRHKLGKCSFKEMRYKQIGIMKKDIDLLRSHGKCLHLPSMDIVLSCVMMAYTVDRLGGFVPCLQGS